MRSASPTAASPPRASTSAFTVRCRRCSAAGNAMADSKPKIACLPNGPYYLLNDMEATPVPNMRRASGEACATVRGVALCRCGGSKNKPFCDGTHTAIGFSDRNTADPGKDERKSYAGKRITILDNRALCAHAGFCTDGVEADAPERPPMVTVTDNGPYAVTGGIELMGVHFGDGASTEHYTLCRCGASKNKPFCDGSHWNVGFRDPA